MDLGDVDEGTRDETKILEEKERETERKSGITCSG